MRLRSPFLEGPDASSGRSGPSPRRLGVATGIAALAVMLFGVAVAGAAAAGGVVAAIERSPLVVVAEVRDVTELAHDGYRATLVVERVLRPGTGAPGGVPDLVEVAWEEPAPTIPPRLVQGRRVLAAVDPLPTASIWRTRVPDDTARARLLALAGQGAGFLERPGAAELDVLEHYLLVDDAARAGDAGALHLARLCAVGQPRIARDAALRLSDFDGLSDHLTPSAAGAVVEALLRTDTPQVSATLLDVIADERPAALRDVLLARMGAAGDDTPPILYAALGALDGQLDDELAMPLLENQSVEARTAAARHASGPQARGRLRGLLRRDPAPSVRAAAATRLVELDGLSALPDATLAFDDESAEVRMAGMRAAASLDPDSVEPLYRLADRGAPQEAHMALAALAMMGDEAHLALAELALEHPDPTIRMLAGIAVGQPLGDRH